MMEKCHNVVSLFFLLLLFRLAIPAIVKPLSCGESATGTTVYGTPVDIQFTAGLDPITFSTCNSDQRAAYLHLPVGDDICDPAENKYPPGCTACSGGVHETWTRTFSAGSQVIQFYWYDGSGGTSYYQIDMTCGTTTSPTTNSPTTKSPTTTSPTTTSPTLNPTNAVPTTSIPTTMIPTQHPTTNTPTTNTPTTNTPTTNTPTTNTPTTNVPTTNTPTTLIPTTYIPTAPIPSTMTPSTNIPTTNMPTTAIPTSSGLTTTSTTQIALYVDVPTETPIFGGNINSNEVVIETTTYLQRDGENITTSDKTLFHLWLYIAIGCLIAVFNMALFKRRTKKHQNIKDTNNTETQINSDGTDGTDGAAELRYTNTMHSSPPNVVLQSQTYQIPSAAAWIQTASDIQLTHFPIKQQSKIVAMEVLYGDEEDNDDDIDGLYTNTQLTHQTVGSITKDLDTNVGGEANVDGMYATTNVQTTGYV